MNAYRRPINKKKPAAFLKCLRASFYLPFSILLYGYTSNAVGPSDLNFPDFPAGPEIKYTDIIIRCTGDKHPLAGGVHVNTRAMPDMKGLFRPVALAIVKKQIPGFDADHTDGFAVRRNF